MTDYRCQVATIDGKRLVLRRRAATREIVIRDLNAEHYFILDVTEGDPGDPGERSRLKAKSVLQFTEIMSTLMSGGLSLRDALSLAKPLGGMGLRGLISNLESRVQKGERLYDALRAGPRGFSPVYLGLIRIGEETGDLTSILPRLIQYLKTQQAIREKTINALTYPSFVLVVAFLGMILLSTLVLPALTQTIQDLNPAVATQYHENVATFQSGGSFLAVILVLAGGLLGAALAQRRRSPAFGLLFDGALLAVPLLGVWIRQSFCLQASFSLELLLEAGFSLEAAMSEVSVVIGNASLRRSWDRSRQSIIAGGTLSHALRSEGHYPEVFVGWIEVGEASNNLKSSFRRLAEFYEGQQTQLTHRFTTLAEPVMIVFVGLVLITLITTFITPIFSMIGGIVR